MTTKLSTLMVRLALLFQGHATYRQKSNSNQLFTFSRSVLSVHGCLFLLAMLAPSVTPGWAQDVDQDNTLGLAKTYEVEIQPLLEFYCYDCHGYGSSEGNFALDQFESSDKALANPEVWWRVLKNMRAGVMPPADATPLTEKDYAAINEWIKYGPFQIDPKNIDPGPITVRRLNREEYGNTVRELMGVPFNEKLLFPPDDTGHGFDNVADALMVSPLLLEKYLHAAETIVDQAVPEVTWIVPRQDFRGNEFRSTNPETPGETGQDMDGKIADTVQKSVRVDEPGRYRVDVAIKQHGSFEFDPARYVVTCTIDDKELFSRELGWDENKRTEFDTIADWDTGEHQITFELKPIKPDSKSGEEILNENSGTNVRFEVHTVSIEGPIGTERRVHPRNYTRFFHRDEPPQDAAERKAYAAEILTRFTLKAFRGKAEPKTIERLTAIAESAYSQPNTTFEAGIGRAMVAALASPKFLFRVETTATAEANTSFALVDELSLASRLSYFLWSTMPDEELFELAQNGELREQLSEQVDRMLKDPKSDAFISNFVGQWLRTRDIQNIAVDPIVVLGYGDEYEELREWLQSRFRNGGGRRGEMSEEDRAKFARFRELRQLGEMFDDELKRAIRDETEMYVEHIARSDSSLLDLLDSDYTFLNEKLAEHYGIENVEGRRMRRVELPADSPRGGVLTHASMLLVTSNPTRTSPVKRGLFVLDNLLGTPAPPAPAVVPELEESANQFKDKEPTLRELLEVHRANDLCASCHARMDPIGFALENFDALGKWRELDGEAPIEPQGRLVTGETFDDIKSLKTLLREQHADDFYRCVTEKLLIYAIGRGVEYSDEHTVDQIVTQLQSDDDTFRTLVHAIVQSAPFQKQRQSNSSIEIGKIRQSSNTNSLSTEE